MPGMTDLVTASRHGDVAVITIDNPPLNVLSPGVPENVAHHVGRAAGDDGVRAVVVTGAGRHFCAGADITTFGMARDDAPDLLGLVDTIAQSAVPVVAAIRGTAFGGGLEIGVMGISEVKLPTADSPLVSIELALKVRFSTEEAVLEVQAQLTDNSWLFSRSCR